MNVSGIRPVGGYYNISSTQRVDSASKAAATTGAESTGTSTSGQSPADTAAQIEKAKSKQTFKAANFDAMYKPESQGRIDNTLRTADVEKAVSDMQKDEVLHQYQYFVGEAGARASAANAGTDAATQQDAAVRGAENFTF